jgi:arylsulfatase A-like enzyme
MGPSRDIAAWFRAAFFVSVACCVVAAFALRVAGRPPPFANLDDRVRDVAVPTQHAAPSPPASLGVVARPTPAPSAAQVPRTYNVVLITVDTLRFDLGYMGYPKPITKNIDALAERSTVFEQTYSTASFTPKSLGPLHIGRYVSETYRDFEHYTTFYPPNVFLAERAHAAGARTMAAMCHRYFTFKSGFQQGFDVFNTEAVPPGMTDTDRRSTSKRLTDVAIDMLSKPKNGGGKFFAWLHYFDPHLPYVSHEGAPEFDKGDKSESAVSRSQYDEEVWFTDMHVGRLLDFIAAQSWANDTAIVLTADHGEAFGEHKHWGHGRELWEPLVRVPLVVFLPGAKPHRVKARRSHMDIAPTIVELLDAPKPAPGSLRGTSLLVDVASPASTPVERDIYIDMPEGPYNEMRRALITGPSPGMKIVDIANRRFELYDLASDPTESKNLSSDSVRLSPYVERMQKFRSTLDIIK